MIAEFIDSWHLFHWAYLSGWLIAALLGMVGVCVVARDQIFLGAAVAEASTLGVALGLWLADVEGLHEAAWVGSEGFLSALSVLFSMLAAVLTLARVGPRGTTEATTGWIFLAAGSVAILLVAHSPHGMEEVHRLISSSIIGATVHDVWLFAVLLALVACGAVWYRRRLLLVLTDEEMAEALGIGVRRWNLALSCLLGLVVGLSLRVSGLLYTFGCLVLPALAARSLCRRALPVIWTAPLIALGTTAVAFVLANRYNQPPGQMAVALLCAVVAAAAASRHLRGGA